MHSTHLTPLHRKLFFIVKTLLYSAYHIETWQWAIYYDSNKHFIALELIGHSLTDWLSHSVMFTL